MVSMNIKFILVVQYSLKFLEPHAKVMASFVYEVMISYFRFFILLACRYDFLNNKGTSKINY